MKNEIPACIGKLWRIIPEEGFNGPLNMARDVALATGVGTGLMPALRIYSFKPACVTIGRFQDFDNGIDPEECARNGIDLARRPTGGLAILHMDDFTYSVSLPHEKPGTDIKNEYFTIIAEAVVESLKFLGIQSDIVEHDENAGESTWCFESVMGVDIKHGKRKICGSAQKIYKRSVLQHGSVFLKENRNAIENLTVFRSGETDGENVSFVSLNEAGKKDYAWGDVAVAFKEGFSKSLGIEFTQSVLTSYEESIARDLLNETFGCKNWIYSRSQD